MDGGVKPRPPAECHCEELDLPARINTLPLGRLKAHTTPMRFLVLLVLLLPLAACAGGPQALGITGPNGGEPARAVLPTPPNPLDNPETLQSGGRYGPSYAPSTGGGNFWGYD